MKRLAAVAVLLALALLAVWRVGGRQEAWATFPDEGYGRESWGA